MLFENIAFTFKLITIVIFEFDMKTALFKTITRRVVAIRYRRFATTYWSQLIGSRIHIDSNFKGQEYKKMYS
jgi:hypothetical protein